MTEQQLRQKMVDTMRGWLGWSEYNGKYKAIIDIYNAQTPLPVGYKVKYTDEWCATCVSAAGIEAGLSDIILQECSCPRMIKLYQTKGLWMENDAYVPQPGDIIMYDWQDTGVGDNLGSADHVGVVAEVTGTTMLIIEGNKGQSVSTRSLAVNGKYIRGYCLPDYAGKATEKESDEMSNPIYKTRDDIASQASWGLATFDKLVKAGYLGGTGEGVYDISYEMLRILVILDRAGAFDK